MARLFLTAENHFFRGAPKIKTHSYACGPPALANDQSILIVLPWESRLWGGGGGSALRLSSLGALWDLASTERARLFSFHEFDPVKLEDDAIRVQIKSETILLFCLWYIDMTPN